MKRAAPALAALAAAAALCSPAAQSRSQTLSRATVLRDTFSSAARSSGGAYAAVTNGEAMAEYLVNALGEMPVWNPEGAAGVVSRLGTATLSVERQNAAGKLIAILRGDPKQGSRAMFFSKSWPAADAGAAAYIPDNALFAHISSVEPGNPFETFAETARETLEKPVRDLFPEGAFSRGCAIFASPSLRSVREFGVCCVLEIKDAAAVESTLENLAGKTLAGTFEIRAAAGGAQGAARRFSLGGLSDIPGDAGVYRRVAAMAAQSRRGGFAMEALVDGRYLVVQAGTECDLEERARLARSGMSAYPFLRMAAAYFPPLRKGKISSASYFSPSAATDAALRMIPGVSTIELATLPRPGDGCWNAAGTAVNGDFVWGWSVTDSEIEACATISEPAARIVDGFILRRLVDQQTEGGRAR